MVVRSIGQCKGDMLLVIEDQSVRLHICDIWMDLLQHVSSTDPPEPAAHEGKGTASQLGGTLQMNDYRWSSTYQLQVLWD